MDYQQDIEQRVRIHRAIHAVEEKTGKRFKNPPLITSGETFDAGVTMFGATVFQTGDLLEELTDRELEGVAAHEIAHNYQTREAVSVVLAIICFISSALATVGQIIALNNNEDFKLDLGKAILTGFFCAFSYFLPSAIQRKMEKDADKFAAEEGYAEARISEIKKSHSLEELTPQHGDWLKEIGSTHPLPYKTVSWLEDYIEEQEKQQTNGHSKG